MRFPSFASLVQGFAEGIPSRHVSCFSDASLAFANLLDETDQKPIDKTRQNLLEYCKLDTLMMMEYIKVLNK